jgi:hypothetical protein
MNEQLIKENRLEAFTGSRLPIKRFAPTSKLFLSWEAWNKII